MIGTPSVGQGQRLGVLGYAGMTFGVAVIVGSLFAQRVPVTAQWLLAFPAFALTALAVRPLPRRRAGGVSFSAFSVFQLIAVPILGPLGTALVGMMHVLLDRRLWRVSSHLVLNLAVAACTGSLSSALYLLVGGVHLTSTEVHNPGAYLTSVLLPMAIAGAALYSLNFALVMGALRFLRIPRPEYSARSTFLHLLPVHLAMGVMAVCAATLWGLAGVGPLACVALIPLLYLARSCFAQYMDAAQARQDVVDTFCAVGSASTEGARDFYRLSGAVAHFLALHLDVQPDELASLSHAVKLQDIAKSCLPYLMGDSQPGNADPDMAYRMRLHPVIAASVLDEIDFLAEAANIVRHHHERWDGQGYPEGRRGANIPRGARILAIANLYTMWAVDARDLDRHSRHEAVLSMLTELAGSVLDPTILAILTGCDAAEALAGEGGILAQWDEEVSGAPLDVWFSHHDPAWNDTVSTTRDLEWEA